MRAYNRPIDRHHWQHHLAQAILVDLEDQSPLAWAAALRSFSLPPASSKAAGAHPSRAQQLPETTGAGVVEYRPEEEGFRARSGPDAAAPKLLRRTLSEFVAADENLQRLERSEHRFWGINE
jgi:hypothetical protein